MGEKVREVEQINMSPGCLDTVAFLPVPMFLLPFLAALASAYSCLVQAPGRCSCGNVAGLGRGDTGTGTGNTTFSVRRGKKEMQPRLVSKFAFIAWNAFTSNFISASEVENIWLFLSLQRCGATTETQDLSGAVLSTLSPWQTGRFEHGT